MLTRFASVIAKAHMDTTDMRLVLQKQMDVPTVDDQWSTSQLKFALITCR